MRLLKITKTEQEALDRQLHGRLFVIHVIADGDGISRNDSNAIFRKYYHSIVLNARTCTPPNGTGEFAITMDCVQDRDGNRLNDTLTTSLIVQIVIKDEYVKIVTLNSVYLLRSLR